MDNKHASTIGLLLAGFLVGVAVTGMATVFAMRSLMIVEMTSPHSFDETVARIQSAAKGNQWKIPQVMDMNKSMAKHGVTFKPRVTLVKVCQPKYAAEILADARHVSCLMPCTLSVYESDDGTVKISKMNTGLMGSVFGGTIARVMGGKVSVDEERILTTVLATE